MSSNSLTNAQGGLTVKGLIYSPKYRTRIYEVLGVDPEKTDPMAEQFISSVVSLSHDRSLANCDPHTIIQSCIESANMKLPVSKELGYAWVVPYNQKGKSAKKAQFQIGYKGYVQFAIRTNAYLSIAVNEVYNNELKSWDRFTEVIEFTGEEPDESSGLAGFFAFFSLKTGYSKGLFWSKKKVEAHAEKYSKSYNSPDGLWKTDFTGMGKKTVLKELLSKWGYLSPDVIPDFTRALKYDQSVIDADGRAHYDDNPSTPSAESDIPDPVNLNLAAIGGEEPRTETSVLALEAAINAVKLNNKKEVEAGWKAFQDVTGRKDTLRDFLKEESIEMIETFANFLQTGEI